MKQPLTSPAVTATQPVAERLRGLRRRAAVAWAGGVLSFALLWAEHRLRVLHPCSLLLILLLVVTFAPAVGALVRGVWQALRGPRRLAALGWVAVSLVPAGLWVALGAYGFHQLGTKDFHNDVPTKLVKTAGVSLMEAQARYLYPHRLESERLVMFYGDGVTDPQADIEAMDRHVARMEEMTGLRHRAKTWWVRGRLLGQRRLCLAALALGSPKSPASALDRHEVAHSIFGQHEYPDSDPPTLLMEGWAEAQSVDPAELALRALYTRQSLAELHEMVGRMTDPEREQFMATLVDPAGMGRLLREFRESGSVRSYLRTLTDPFWYHHDNGAVYPVGGAFVDFVLRRYGATPFVDLCSACRAGTFEAECRRVYRSDLDALERDFWADLEKTKRAAPAPRQRTRAVTPPAAAPPARSP